MSLPPGLARQCVAHRRWPPEDQHPCRRPGLPQVGAHKNDSYEGDGYVIVRDPSTDVVKQLLATVIKTVRVHYAD